MPLVPVFSWYEMKIHTDISSKDHKKKEMESITCYKMAIKLKQQQHNQVGLRPKRSFDYSTAKALRKQAFPLDTHDLDQLFSVMNTI